MMGGWVRYLQLQAKAKSGLSTAVAVWGVIALVGLVATLIFLTFACFIWLTQRYDALLAALIMAGAFLVIAIIGALGCLIARKSAVTRARLALAERKSQPWLDPAMLGVGLQVGRTVGWGRLLSLGAVAVLAAGLGREWLGGRGKADDSANSDDAPADQGRNPESSGRR